MVSSDKLAVGATVLFFVVGVLTLFSFFYWDSETRTYSFEFDNRPENPVVILEAPQGFEAGNEVVINRTLVRFDNDIESNNEYLEVAILNRDVQILGYGHQNRAIVLKKENGSKRATPVQSLSGGDTFTLDKGTSLRAAFGYTVEGNQSKKYSEIKKVDVSESDDVRFFIALLALVGLCSSMLSGIRDIDEISSNSRFDDVNVIKKDV